MISASLLSKPQLLISSPLIPPRFGAFLLKVFRGIPVREMMMIVGEDQEGVVLPGRERKWRVWRKRWTRYGRTSTRSYKGFAPRRKEWVDPGKVVMGRRQRWWRFAVCRPWRCPGGQAAECFLTRGTARWRCWRFWRRCSCSITRQGSSGGENQIDVTWTARLSIHGHL